MTKSLKNWWGRLLFQGRGILPTKRLLLYVVAFSLVLTLLGTANFSWSILIFGNGMLFLISLLDLFFSPKRKDITINRTIPEELERGLTYPVKLEVKNDSVRSMRYTIVDGLPQSFLHAFPLSGLVEEKSSVTATYEIVAPVRGRYRVKQLYLRYTSLFQLWEKQTTIELPDTVNVIPDLSDAKSYLESARQFLLYEGMEIRKRQRGEGEFAQIRNFVVGDDSRKINWRQTAKLQEVMTNEYEPEHGKYLSVLIDCGRMMGVELEEGNRLEKALEAALAVSAAALKNGDYVSVVAFSKNIHVYVPPGKGLAHLQKILHAVYDVKVEPGESNYAAVLNYLQSVQKKRSLILLFSDVQAFLHEESGLTYLNRLRRRHLFFMLGIEDETLPSKISAYPDTVRQAMVKSIAQQQMQVKKREKAKWEKQGLSMIETKEERLTATAISRYIDIMNRGLL